MKIKVKVKIEISAGEEFSKKLTDPSLREASLLMTSFFVMMQSSVYQLFYDHIKLNYILWFLLLFPFWMYFFFGNKLRIKVKVEIEICAGDEFSKRLTDPSLRKASFRMTGGFCIS